MMDDTKRGVAICHYNRLNQLPEVIEAVQKTTPEGTRVVVCDDGSDVKYNLPDGGAHETTNVQAICKEAGVPLIAGPNLGVAANKNRALWALQDCHLLCILEDDLKPIESGWFEFYEKATYLSGIHHFCRVQDKEVSESVPSFRQHLRLNGLSTIYGPSPRGDLTFLTRKVISEVGAFNPRFRGAGYAHGEWSNRVARAGLIGHPQRWVDIQEARDCFVQLGDTEGGRWELSEEETKRQLGKNKAILKELQRNEYTYHPLVLE